MSAIEPLPISEGAAWDDASSYVGPHEFHRMGWRWWLCSACYAPRSLHPRRAWTRARPLLDHTYLSADAPHFKEGW